LWKWAAFQTPLLWSGAQRASAKKIQELLLDETPIIYPYFYFFLTGTKKNVGNVEVSAMGHYDITKAGFTSGS